MLLGCSCRGFFVRIDRMNNEEAAGWIDGVVGAPNTRICFSEEFVPIRQKGAQNLFKMQLNRIELRPMEDICNAVSSQAARNAFFWSELPFLSIHCDFEDAYFIFIHVLMTSRFMYGVFCDSYLNISSCSYLLSVNRKQVYIHTFSLMKIFRDGVYETVNSAIKKATKQ
ncbi:hypothetical protein EGR_09262 [Echinococcus granulosus]|uniref:Uncharacterized protein n=1 Tax=Echinococcus granulosus TaxID=6210 RepID=W6UR17_ECHGR|nr:hypothetical protein EGR_09262 [Echinococcus granulosus]EUB55859.1 hypothetical protein EGR_09262 [Echinococcus granulosus]